MAFVLRCIASECRRHGVSGSEIGEITYLLWGLVESEDLDAWRERTVRCASLGAVIDEIDGLGPRMGESALWPEHLRRMVFEAYEFGCHELYGGVSGVSAATLALAVGIARRAVEAGGSVPTFADLTRSWSRSWSACCARSSRPRCEGTPDRHGGR